MADLAWRVERFIIGSGPDPIEYHTFAWPSNDSMEHNPFEYSCPCMPTYKLHIGVHGYHEKEICICTLDELIHHSLDGRELSE